MSGKGVHTDIGICIDDCQPMISPNSQSESETEAAQFWSHSVPCFNSQAGFCAILHCVNHQGHHECPLDVVAMAVLSHFQ